MDFVKEALRQNVHWETGKILIPRLNGPLVEREAFSVLKKAAGKKFITAVLGLRRVGKSVLAKEFMAGALGKGGKPADVAWFEFDRAMKADESSLDSIISFFEARNAKTIILDEVQLVAGWQDVLKRFYDRTDLKFIVTGSSALEMDKRSAESLAGRLELVFVKPFSLKEFLMIREKKPPLTQLDFARKSEEMLLECDEYLRIGGMPEAIRMKSTEERRAYANNSLLDPLFYKDLPAVFPQANPDMLRKTLELLCATAGSTFQYQTIAQVLGCNHPTASLQVELLEKALLARVVYNRTASVVKQKRTEKKIAIADNGILAALRTDVSMGVLAENAVANTVENARFWRDNQGREVDFLNPAKKLAVEVKYQEHVTTTDEKHLRYFLERNKGWKAIMVTKNSEEKSDIEHTPLWKWMLENS